MEDSDQPPEQGRAARRAKKTRQRLLDSALAVFSEQGVDASAIEDITEHADVGKGTFYRHFSDKAAILAALTDLAVGDLAACLREAAGSAGTVSETVDRIMAAECDWLKQRPAAMRLLLQAQALLSVRPQALPGVQPPLQWLVAETERLIARTASAPPEALALRRLTTATLAAPLGLLAFQQAAFGQDPTDSAEAVRPLLATALPQVLRCAV